MKPHFYKGLFQLNLPTLKFTLFNNDVIKHKFDYFLTFIALYIHNLYYFFLFSKQLKNIRDIYDKVLFNLFYETTTNPTNKHSINVNKIIMKV